MTASPKTTDAMLSPLNAPPDSPTELLLGSKDYATHRPKLLRTNNAANENIQPAAIALPKTADEVARVVRWATASGLRLVVRGAGNDFFSHSIADGALVIDMRHLNAIQVGEEGETVQVWGGGVARDLVKTLCGARAHDPDRQHVDHWVCRLGPSMVAMARIRTNLCGMGFEQIVGAQLVNAKGEVVDATEEMLEGVRGVPGHLGIRRKFPGTTPPGEKTAAQVFGGNWPRASSLKRRYDPENVFCHAIPKM
ncbi:hypothetical protein MCOR18_004972 [Pyricularia oryzae]|uniref:FAD-binding PCMH-type domain-containing protein n=1 Tax=Pyricularia oryzae TaxID=318829 RepID=A0A4P7N3U1_PYROR|nr:hypothetical protein MCOR18_004972 [Pyricularia oryzae]QBZ56182.1 hypothetical protein PoMZ_01088 [Pyricularia oryzae]